MAGRRRSHYKQEKIYLDNLIFKISSGMVCIAWLLLEMVLVILLLLMFLLLSVVIDDVADVVAVCCC